MLKIKDWLKAEEMLGFIVIERDVNKILSAKRKIDFKKFSIGDICIFNNKICTILSLNNDLRTVYIKTTSLSLESIDIEFLSIIIEKKFLDNCKEIFNKEFLSYADIISLASKNI